MATPFKRICFRAAPIQRPQWRTITTTTPLRAQPDNLTPSDPTLDQLTKTPGVTYSLTTEPDKDLSKYNPTDLSSLGHRELEQHRELREMVRLAAWEMPLLSALSRPAPQYVKEHVLRWRYTTYMGEAHPASRKVVVTFSPHGIPNITTEQVLKLKKLAGPRYNPSKNEIKMSCESFETQAQNKRYLATTINALIAEATDPEADSFADVPLDLRHHKRKPKHRFPEEWKMTNERRMQLEGGRRERMLGEVKRIEENEVASGLQDIEKMKGLDLKQEEHIMAEARAPMPTGKMGKREMGQQKVQRP